jgi:uncharacterized protein YybS (DUF2232 family)
LSNSQAWTNALMAALFMVPLFIFMPLIPLLFLILPLPFLWATAGGSALWSVGVGVLSGLLWVVWTGQSGVLFFISYALVVGTAMGLGYRRYQDAFHAAVIGVLSSLAMLVVSIVLSYFLFQVNWISEMKRWMLESVLSAEELFQNQGMPVPWDPKLWSEVNLNVVPFILVAFSVIVVTLNHAIAVRFLPKTRVKTYRFPPLKDWQIPRSVVFYYVITFLVSLLVGQEEGSFLAIATMNLLPLFTYVLAVQGLSLIAYWADIRKKGRWLSNLSVFLFLVFPPFVYLYNLLGILDLGFSVRNRIRP